MIKHRKELFIEIKGTAGQGKTLMALALKKFLTEQGFDDIVVSDNDIDEHTNHTQRIIENFDEIWKTYATNSTIKVNTTQLVRNCFL
jgi:pantothenate kinase-related protein Tda10